MLQCASDGFGFRVQAARTRRATSDGVHKARFGDCAMEVPQDVLGRSFDLQTRLLVRRTQDLGNRDASDSPQDPPQPVQQSSKLSCLPIPSKAFRGQRQLHNASCSGRADSKSKNAEREVWTSGPVTSCEETRGLETFWYGYRVYRKRCKTKHFRSHCGRLGRHVTSVHIVQSDRICGYALF